MRIAVVGLWHLGCITAACLANSGHQVIAYDPNPENINQLQQGQAPLFEPGLDNLLTEVKTSGKLMFSDELTDITPADVVWITFDTPVDKDDNADSDYVIQQVHSVIHAIKKNSLVIISSQVPVGTTNKLQKYCSDLLPESNISFACVPENLRLGKAIEVFTHPDRIIIGLDDYQYKNILETLLKPFSENLIWMSIVSAEMTKHAINAFLGLSVTFINELAALCETVGANAREVELGLKSEERIGQKAYLRPGDAIAGGTLMRDINYLTQLGKVKNRQTFLLSAIAESNQYHKQWVCRKLTELLNDLNGKQVAMLGLTYKAGTNTLRRSAAIETCEWLHQQGTKITAFDPTISQLPNELAHFIQIKSSIVDALTAADAVVISTEWPQFRELRPAELIENLKQPFIIDPSGFVAKNMASDLRLHYFSVGIPS